MQQAHRWWQGVQSTGWPQRSVRLMVQRWIKSHCDNGHEFTPANTKIRADGSRACRACLRIRDRERNKKGRKARDE